jgi:REP element-mobilizing transposase RayT
MGRYPRPYLPGVAFHLTTRVQNRAHLFVPPLRTHVVRLLRRHLLRTDARLLAYVVMTNHLHLVLIQGVQPLEALMQPFLRSVALATHAVHGTEGHVFERRFGDRRCRDAHHLRNAIAYTHANPVRAGLCAEPADYEWSSHRLYLGSRPRGVGPPVDVDTGLSAFSPVAGSPIHGTRPYGDLIDEILADPLRGWAGREEEIGHPSGATSLDRPGPGVPDIEAIAGLVLESADMPWTLAQIRSRWGPRSRLPVRGRIAIAASRAGFNGRQIATFLGVSPATVSRDLAGTRSVAPGHGPQVTGFRQRTAPEPTPRRP